MSEPKWTKGHWHIVRGEDDPQIAAGVIHIATIETTSVSPAQTEANARLIVSAQKLYEALNEACDLIEGTLVGAKMLRGETLVDVEQTSETTRFRALLAKARGE